jgi:hypothetical protein
VINQKDCKNPALLNLISLKKNQDLVRENCPTFIDLKGLKTMSTSFTELMSQKSDEQLLKIVARPGDYQPEAFEAAQREITKRNLSMDRIEVAKSEVIQEEKISTAKAHEPLEGSYKALSFFLPGIIALMLSSALRTNGYERKASDLVRWTVFGFGFYITIVIFFSMLA